jgi:phosphopantothenoylcysteine decarboxylase/phosphopantothenate--cysteine ligase
MTPASKDFVTPLTLSTLSKNPVILAYNDGNKKQSGIIR